MGFERFPSPPAESLPNLDAQDEIHRVLESGSDEEFERLRKHIEQRHRIEVSHELMETLRQFARQRRRLINQSDAETKIRQKDNPKATPEEYDVGVYRERLEGPVRDAVFTVRQKGYAPYESGFSGVERQRISFVAPIAELKAHIFSERVVSAFHAAGAEPFVDEKGVGFTPEALLSDTEMTDLWNLLAADLPQLQEAQPRSSILNATDFRQKQDRQFGPRT